MSINVSAYWFWYVCDSIFTEFYLTFIISSIQHACNQCFTQPAFSGFIIQKQENNFVWPKRILKAFVINLVLWWNFPALKFTKPDQLIEPLFLPFTLLILACCLFTLLLLLLCLLTTTAKQRAGMRQMNAGRLPCRKQSTIITKVRTMWLLARLWTTWIVWGGAEGWFTTTTFCRGLTRK